MDREPQRADRPGGFVAPAGFDALVREHGPAVFGFLARRVRDRALAEDLAQETFLRAWRGRSGFRGPETAERGWLLAIAGNIVRDHERKRRRRVAESAPLDDEDPGLRPGLGVAPDPSVRVEQGEALQRLRVALGALPEHHREMFLLRERDGLSYKEIAAVLGCPIGSVMSGLARARERLLAAVEG